MEDILLIKKIIKAIEDKKGEDILVLQVKKICSFADYLIIAKGNIPRHTNAIKEEVIFRCKKEGVFPFRSEGIGDWIVIDYGSIVIHIFTPEFREKYQLEKLWEKGKILNLEERL